MEGLAPLGEAVRRARVAKALTIKGLADRSGVSARFLSDLERGKGNISIARLLCVSRALHVPLADLVAPLDSKRSGPVIALVGLRGAGKSTIGKQAATVLELPFVELDSEIEARAALPLQQIFEIHGETYYRRLEKEVLSKVLAELDGGCVLAVGGGIVNDPETWRLLRERAKTIWLKASPSDHYGRVMEQGDLRPMHNRPSAMAELQNLLNARAPLYAQSEIAVDTSALRLQSAVDSVCAAVHY